MLKKVKKIKNVQCVTNCFCKGLNELLEKVKEVYGGEGKVKVKKKNKTNNQFSFKL